MNTLPAIHVKTPSLTPAQANQALVDAGHNDLAEALILWRTVTNTPRLQAAGRHDVLDAVGTGRIVASLFADDAISATRTTGGWTLRSAKPTLCTGLNRSDYALTVAATPYGPTAFILEASQLHVVAKPTFRGLTATDNSLVALPGVTVGDTDVVGDTGAAEPLIQLPYDHGITLAAVHLGGLHRLIGLLTDHADAIVDEVAAVAALAALIDKLPRLAPDAGTDSRAAKVLAAAITDRLLTTARRRLGASAYAASHPLNGLADDLAGLPLMAPTNRGAHTHLASRIAGGTYPTR